ncbi:unnamed protein product, partial [Vitis vinifera]
MEEGSNNRAEAERLLGVAEKLLHTRDFNGSKDFAILAQETEPLLDGTDQILAVADVLIASEKRINNHHDWYAILQTDRRSDDLDLIKKQYRRLALLLHPDKNKFVFADHAFKLVADAWAVLSDPAKKSLYDNELSLFSKVDLAASGSSDDQRPLRLTSFWTACPYCYILYEYPRVYEGCCLRCQNCQRAFHAALVPSLPPLVPGKEAYYCCWGFFPLGFAISGAEGGKGKGAGGFPNWMPPMFGGGVAAEGGGGSAGGVGVVEVSDGSASAGLVKPKRRGRPPKKAVHPILLFNVVLFCRFWLSIFCSWTACKLYFAVMSFPLVFCNTLPTFSPLLIVFLARESRVINTYTIILFKMSIII